MTRGQLLTLLGLGAAVVLLLPSEASAEMIGVSPFSPRLNLGGSYVPPPWARPFLSDFAAATARYH
ncbi:MAG: hypothetical protein ACYCUI_11615, partial [Vulcanimicrobiaceae bacterium]